MLNLLRDIGLSFCPVWFRTAHRPDSPSFVLRAAIITGAFQTYFCSRWFVSEFIAFLSVRSQQYGSALERQTVTTQSWFGIVFFLEYLIFHPLGLLLFYLTWEGIVRFAAGLVLSEVVPSLPLVTALAFRRYLERKKTRHAAQELASIPDSFEVLADVERLRIAAALAKPTWNASLTIGIDGQLYEVESVQEGTPPRRYVYVLKKASSGKILRGYEEYHLGIAKLS